MKFKVGDPVWYNKTSHFRASNTWTGIPKSIPPMNVSIEASVVAIVTDGYAVELNGFPSGYPGTRIAPQDSWTALECWLKPRHPPIVKELTVPWSQCIWKPSEIRA